MSSEDEEERKEYVRRDPTVQGTVVTAPTDQVVARREPVERVVVPATTSASPVEHRETIVRHRSTNTGAVIAMVIGVIVLMGGIYMVLSQIPFLPWPLSMIAFLAVGLIFIGVGASLLGNRSTN